MEFLTTARMRKYFVCVGRMVERGLEEGRREVVNLLGRALTLVAGEKSQEKKNWSCRRHCKLHLGVVGFNFLEQQKAENQGLQQRRTTSHEEGEVRPGNSHDCEKYFNRFSGVIEEPVNLPFAVLGLADPR